MSMHIEWGRQKLYASMAVLPSTTYSITKPTGSSIEDSRARLSALSSATRICLGDCRAWGRSPVFYEYPS